MHKVIVIGGDHHNTLGVLRSLGERDIFSELLLVSSSKRTFVNYSKYVTKCRKVSTDDKVVEILLNNFIDVIEKPVIICCSDSSASVIDENRDVLSAYFILPGIEQQGRLTELMSKKRMAELAVETEMRIPYSVYVTGPFVEFSSINLPCIIKPIESRRGKKSDISICWSNEDILTYMSSHDIMKTQIQEYIEKDFEYQLIGCSTNKEIIIPGVSKILRPCKGSNTSFLHYEPADENSYEIEKCLEFVRRTGYHGLFSMEFLRDKYGNDYFLEINFRNDGNAICVTEAGVNLPYIWYLACTGQDYQEEKARSIKSSYIMPDFAELKLMLTGQISLIDYFNDLRKTDRFMEYDKKDPKPFWRMVRAKLHLW